MPIIRTWANGGRGARHPGCDGTCVEFRPMADLFAMAGWQPPRCPRTPRERRELARLLAAAQEQVLEQEAVLRAEAAAFRVPVWG